MIAAFVLLFAPSALAQSPDPVFPALSGRVVDAANLLSADDRASLDATLKRQDDKASDQVVVATVPSLGGLPIEDYANRLFRAWKLGQAKTNNGVLLLVAPTERKVRIEVGYGLEGSLTDAVASTIIRVAVTPRFRAGDYPGGIKAGIDAILGVLNGDAAEWQDRARQRPRQDDQATTLSTVVAFFILVIVFLIVVRFIVGRGGTGTRYHRRRDGTWVAMPYAGGFADGWSSGGGWGGGFGGGSGGGFSGGGGSSGGGGASGSW